MIRGYLGDEDYDYESWDLERSYYKPKKKYMISHSWRTIIGLAIMFIIGGLQAIKGQVDWKTLIDTVIPVLLVVEHSFFGNTKE